MEKLIKNFPHYKITDKGEIFSLYQPKSSYVDSRSTWTKVQPYISKTNGGYVMVSLVHKGVTKQKRVHRLMCEAFIPNPENKPYVNHKDGDKTNYQLDNLEWVTAQENSIHASDTGLNDNAYAATSKPVNQLHKQTGELINEFSSIGEAAKCIGIAWQNIASVCKGNRKSAGGFAWGYA